MLKSVFRSRMDALAPDHRVPFVCVGDSMTKQSEKDRCDINVIMRQYKRTGLVAHTRAGGSYESLPDAMDYQQALAVVAEAREAFSVLPATVRDRFGNEPASLLAFLRDPANREEGIAIGLFSRPQGPPEAAADGGGGPPPAPAK